MTDALHLVMLKKSELAEVEDTFKSYTRVLPCDDHAHNLVGETMHYIRLLFYKLCSIRDKINLNSTQFEKMHVYKNLKACGLQRVNLSLLFQKHSNKEKTIELLKFVDMLKALHLLCIKQNAEAVPHILKDFVVMLYN